MDFATSVIPGWHTTVFPPFFLTPFIILFILLFESIVYWQIHKTGRQVNKRLTISHILFTFFFSYLYFFHFNITAFLLKTRYLGSFIILQELYWLLFPLFLIAQIFFIWNIIWSYRHKYQEK